MVQSIIEIIPKLVIASVFMHIAGLCDGKRDFLLFKYEDQNQFWNPRISWTNKWKDGIRERGERFFKSSTWFVSITDGFHLVKAIHTVSIVLSVTFVAYISFSILESFLISITFRVLYWAGFWITYTRKDEAKGISERDKYNL